MIVHALLLALAPLSSESFKMEENGRDVFPAPFRGLWAPSVGECGGDRQMVLTISADRVSAYESDGVLLKNAGLILESGPGGSDAYSTMALLAYSGEGEVGIGKFRVSRVGDALYTSNADVVPEDKHFARDRRMVRCP